MRPSSGEAPAKFGTDMDVAFLMAPPSETLKAMMKAKGILAEVGLNDADRDVLHGYAKYIYWDEHGTSYIVDELIGGPWD